MYVVVSDIAYINRRSDLPLIYIIRPQQLWPGNQLVYHMGTHHVSIS
jgi:hypothetical protein